MEQENAGARGYSVIKQEQTVARLPDDSFGQVVRVTFRTTAGMVLSVDVPATAYTADNVKAAIEERARHADEIQNL